MRYESYLRTLMREWKSIIRFGVYTGQRLADFAMLTRGKINIPQAEIRLRTRKTDKPLIIPIAPPPLDALKVQPKPANPAPPAHQKAYQTLSSNGTTTPLPNHNSNTFRRKTSCGCAAPHPWGGVLIPNIPGHPWVARQKTRYLPSSTQAASCSSSKVLQKARMPVKSLVS